jgi:hypothetical protein
MQMQTMVRTGRVSSTWGDDEEIILKNHDKKGQER